MVVFKPSKDGEKGERRSSVRFQTRSHDSVEASEVDPDEARRPIRVGAELTVLSGATRFELGNGMRVVLLPVNAMPVVAAELIFDVGEAAAPDSPLLASAAASFLSQPRDSTVLGQTGVRMACDATPDHTICRARGMSIYADVVSIYADVDVALLYPSPAGMSGQLAVRMVLTEMLNARMSEIRGRLGATYGTRARRDSRLGPSAYRLGGAVDAPRAGEAVKAMRDGIEGLRRGDTDFDVAFVRARRKILQQLLGESTISAELAARLGQIARFGLPPDHYNTLLRQVGAVSPTQVKELLARELDPGQEVLVLLGDRASVTRAFADAGIEGARLVEPAYR